MDLDRRVILIVEQDRFKRINIDQNNKLCNHGIGNGICIKTIDPGVADYTQLPKYPSKRRIVYNLMVTN